MSWDPPWNKLHDDLGPQWLIKEDAPMPDPTPKLTVVRWLTIGNRRVPEFKMEISDEAMREGLEKARTPKPTAEVPDHHLLKHDAEVRTKAFDEAAEAGRAEAMAIFNDCWRELKNSGDARHVIERMSGFGERVASSIRALAKEQANGA